jgi:dipeptidyl aminopeptidase/acylaminoacyl peptidase
MEEKGAYLLTELRRNITLDSRKLIDWNDYPRNDGLPGSGLFSRLSPDGDYIASTGNDISFLATLSDPYCSQLFFPIQGHLALYSKRDGRMSRLPTGSKDTEIVETDPSWSPDSRYVLFSRTAMQRDYYFELGGHVVFSSDGLDLEQLNEKYPVQFDVYRVPFNAGRGGKAVPLPGASHNGKSNYFARYSPDGRWIVFTQSRSGIAIQPDSTLHIMPAEGGAARILNCNRSRVNSWHTWSPNSRWLAFVSKENMPYSELYLTHIDEYGNDSVPIRLSRLNKPGYAINVPEFADIKSGSIRNISLVSGRRK